MRTLFNEETTVEREIIEHLKAAKLGWTWRSREQLIAYRPDEREVLLLPLLREKLKELNPAVLTDEARVDAIITKLRGCRDNQQWLAWLKRRRQLQVRRGRERAGRAADRLRKSGCQRLVGDQPVSGGGPFDRAGRISCC